MPEPSTADEDAPASGLAPTTPVEPPESKEPADVLLKVLGVVGTGLGILGFVTFFGGAIVWVRLNEAHLPATEAVAVIPNSVLVTTGAAFLAPAVAAAAAVVAATFLVYLFFGLRGRREERKEREDAQHLRQRAEAMGRDANAAVQGAKAARAVTTSLEEALTKAEKSGEPDGRVAQLKKEVSVQRQDTVRLELASQSLASTAVAAKAKADNRLEELNIDLERSRGQIKIEITAGALALFLLPLLLNGTIWHVGWWRGFLLLVTLALAAAITTYVYAQTERFIWFGITAFVTVGLYIGLATYVSTSRNVKMQPLAALRTGHEPVFGAFIADTTGNLYVGTFEETEKEPHMLVIPRAQVSELTVGSLEDPGDARRRAIEMALDACAQQVQLAAADSDSEEKDSAEKAATQPKPEAACSPEQKKTLQDALEAS
jgi:hypothetical protein